MRNNGCLLYTSDAADERSSVDLGGRRIIKKKKKENIGVRNVSNKIKNTNKKSTQEDATYRKELIQTVKT